MEKRKARSAVIGCFHQSRPLVITPCTSRKRHSPQISAEGLPRGTQREVCSAWLRALTTTVPRSRAADLYAGRAFGLAKQAAKILGADFAIASAGLGMVMAGTMIPSYDLTIGRGGIREEVIGGFDPIEWWRAISLGPYASDVAVTLMNRPLILACVSRAYAPLLGHALQDISTERLRIFGKGLALTLPIGLQACVLPYDQRLDTKIPGTRGDFAQRALLHYVKTVFGVSKMPLEDEKAAVLAALATTAAPKAMPKRVKLDDAAIREIIIRLLPTIGPRRSVMLRHLRDVEGIACEQGRFNSLFRAVVK